MDRPFGSPGGVGLLDTRLGINDAGTWVLATNTAGPTLETVVIAADGTVGFVSDGIGGAETDVDEVVVYGALRPGPSDGHGR